jgi:hypothetical protein
MNWATNPTREPTTTGGGVCQSTDLMLADHRGALVGSPAGRDHRQRARDLGLDGHVDAHRDILTRDSGEGTNTTRRGPKDPLRREASREPRVPVSVWPRHSLVPRLDRADPRWTNRSDPSGRDRTGRRLPEVRDDGEVCR